MKHLAPPIDGDDKRPLRVAIVVETYAREMGYLSNTLPKYLARLGHHVDLITSELFPYFQLGSAASLFGAEFAERNRNRIGCDEVDGYKVHTLPIASSFGYARLQGLRDKLSEIAPQVVCVLTSVGWVPLDGAAFARRLGYTLVTGSHTGNAYFPLAQRHHAWYSMPRIRCLLLRTLPGRFVGSVAHHCVVPTRDCADIVVDFFGVARSKVRVMNLPVDPDFFYPVRSDADAADRLALRASLGYSSHETVCVYTGKFTSAKNPRVLVEAIEILAREGHAVCGLFVGSGAQSEQLRASPLATVLPFMPIRELGRYFRAADVGIWTEESASFLEGASCGLPLVLSDAVNDVSHLSGFLSVFKAHEPRSLADSLRPLLDPGHRQQVGRVAASLANERFSALRYASQRVAFFHEALRAGPKQRGMTVRSRTSVADG